MLNLANENLCLDNRYILRS